MKYKLARFAPILASVLFVPSIALADVQYTVTDLGALPGDTESWPTAINSSGQVVGYSAVPGAHYNAWLYSNGSMTSLGNPAFPGSQAFALNDVGQVVGTSNGPNQGGAFVSSSGSMQYIGNGLVPTGINDSGTIVGNYFANTEDRAFIYNNGVVQDLGTLPGGNSAFAYAINGAGEVAGASDQPGGGHAFIYTNGVMQDLGTLGGATSGAFAINSLGHVVGISETGPGSGSGHAFLYTQSTGMVDIGQSLGTAETTAFGVNDSDQVVGYINGDSGNRAFLYSGGVLYDLNDLIDPSSGAMLARAVGINDAGQIIAWGDLGSAGPSSGGTQAFLLTPAAPEPAASGIAAVAAFGLLWRRRRGQNGKF